MGDLGDDYRAMRDARRNGLPGQYQCQCGWHVWKRKPACPACKRPNPLKAAKAAPPATEKEHG